MSRKTYHGSCYCGQVTYEADIDLSQGTGKCNCEFCTKSRNWSVIIKPADFRQKSGEDSLTSYQKASESPSDHQFCKVCGVRTFDRGHLDAIGGDYVAIFLSSLDDLDSDELAAAPIRYFDGRNANWMNPPKDTRNL